MGACSTRNDVQTLESKEIDFDLKKYAKTLHNQVKMLLLGPGESGKSTVFKQMKIIQDKGGFTEEELLTFKSVIHSNCLSQMKVLITAATNLQIPLGTKEARDAAEKLLQLHHQGVTLSPEIATLVNILWSDKGIQSVYELRGKKFQLNDTADYFFKEVNRISKEDYTPSIDDVLRARIRSTGIEEAEFTFEKLTFTMVDVGGQRAERRKWIHCFDNVTVILFFAALSEYNQTLREEKSQNRMEEALILFGEISNSQTYKNSIILFLNKIDLFDEKIQKVPLTVCFDDYTGETSEDAKLFIKERFLEKISQKRTVFVHFTCALDTKNIQYVIRSVRERLLNKDIEETGLKF